MYYRLLRPLTVGLLRSDPGSTSQTAGVYRRPPPAALTRRRRRRRSIALPTRDRSSRLVSVALVNRQTPRNGDQLEQTCGRITTEDQELHAVDRRLAGLQKVGEYIRKQAIRNDVGLNALEH